RRSSRHSLRVKDSNQCGPGLYACAMRLVELSRRWRKKLAGLLTASYPDSRIHRRARIGGEEMSFRSSWRRAFPGIAGENRFIPAKIFYLEKENHEENVFE